MTLPQAIEVAAGIGNLADYPPDMFALPDGSELIEGEIELGVRLFRGKLNFSMQDVAGNFVRFDEQARRRFIAITRNTRLTIRLSKKVKWAFDFESGPIRLKNGNDARFFKTHEIDARTIVLEAMRNPTQEWTVQPFNIYVLIEQRLGPPLPVRIDPDVDNPPI